MDLAFLFQTVLPRLALAFVIGAVPFAWLLVRLCKGIDVRTVGSGNAGATNASRAFDGKGARLLAFLAVYVLDAGKGWLGVQVGAQSPTLGLTLAVACAAAAVLGHIFSPFLRFRGGKGVATATGALFALDWQVTLVALAVFFVVRLLTGQVFFGSLALGFALPVATWALHPETAFGVHLPLFLLCAVLAVLLVWTHRSNLKKHFAKHPAEPA